VSQRGRLATTVKLRSPLLTKRAIAFLFMDILDCLRWDIRPDCDYNEIEERYVLRDFDYICEELYPGEDLLTPDEKKSLFLWDNEGI